MSETETFDDAAPAPAATEEYRAPVLEIDKSMDKLAPSVFETLAKNTAERETTAPSMPSLGFDSIDSTVDAVGEWLDKPLDERQSISIAHGEIERRKSEAKALGISLADREAIQQTERLNRPVAASAPVFARAAEIYPGRAPEETISVWADIDKYARANPEQGLRHIASQLGVDIDAMFGNGQSGASAVQSAVGQFLGKNADAEKFIPDIVEAIQSRAFQRSGNPLADLETAFKQVKRQKSGRKADARPAWERSMDERWGT